MKAAIALQCTTGNCLYQDASPPPTPSSRQGFWTGEMITLLGMTLLLLVALLGVFASCIALCTPGLSFASLQRLVFSSTTTRWLLPRTTQRMAPPRS